MLKVCTAFHRKPGLSVDEYQGYWSNDHPAFVKRLPGLLGYTQNRPLRSSFEMDPHPPYDGFVELWFRDSAALKTMSASQEFADLCEDEHNFADRSKLKIVFTSEHVINESPSASSDIKRITFLKRPKGVDASVFQEQLLTLAGSKGAAEGAHRLVISLPRLNGYADDREPAWDGYEMAWFTDLETALTAPSPNIETRQSPALFCSEHIVVNPSV